MAEVSGGPVRGKPRLGCIDSVGGLGQLRNDSGGCATMRERVVSPYAYVTDVTYTNVTPILFGPVFFRTALS